MKSLLKLIAATIIITTNTNAHEEPCPEIIKTAVQELYTMGETKDYICGPDIDCTIENFTNALEISNIQLHANTAAPDAIQITPKTKGTSYFTAIFLMENCKSRLVFYPDTSSSGIKLLKPSSNGMFIIRSTARQSRAQWSETDYHYDLNKQAYQEQKTVCYAIHATRTARVKCQ
ncbi:hypothetical protein [Azohydromonas australica]|uniref:hypothetical protein n=1 Tax=Azohydromonas australica TaxID=364039 RepID=UPI0012EC0106|nr:hypothetical protein [Azohydromonas australica]